MVEIPNLEIHVTHACNLACEQCSHFSNLNHKGILSVKEIDYQMGLWSFRIQPRVFSILGGEPGLNPDLPQIINLCKVHWPNSRLQLISNGFLLDRHPELPKILKETDCSLEVSVHHESKEYLEKIKPYLDLIEQWRKDYGIKLNIRPSSKNWRRVYLGEHSTMKPYNDNNQRESWEVCVCKWCPQIYLDRIWKCPPLAYLKMTLDKLKLSDDPEWAPYLKYRPLEPYCSDTELRDFLLTQDESYCKMCPANPESFSLPSPLR